jgi:RNA polymerase sigma-70 factor (ECF subfamily)
MDSEERAEAIRRTVADFVKELDSETRVLFVRRYFYAESVKELSKRFGMSENAISVRLHRARARLKLLLEKEDIHV